MQPKSLPLLEQITQNPLLIESGANELFQSSINHVINHPEAEKMLSSATMAAANDDDFWPTTDGDWRAAYRPYIVKDGVLQIPVMGVLLSRFPYQLGRWATGYQYIAKCLERGLADDNVKKIAFVCDTPGGEVTECFELKDKIYEARGKKPMRAFAANHAYSAGYAIASACDEIVITRSGGVGSVGVVTAHVDYSAAMEKYGIKVTFIFAGDHKVDGNPYEKLPAAVKSRIQKRINKIYGVFTSTVARDRGMDESDVIATKALTYDPEEAIEVGFADKIGALDEEMVLYATETGEEDSEMANDNATKVEGIDKATHDAAVAKAHSDGMTAGKDRIKSILGCDEAKARPAAALSAALNTSMTADEAKAFLATLPEEKAPEAKTDEKPDNASTQPGGQKPQAKTPFETAMESGDNPDVGADTNGKQGKTTDEDLSASILSDYAGASNRRKTAA